MKLERFGRYTLVRSEPKAWWKPDAGGSLWDKADARFHDDGRWTLKKGAPRQWEMDLHGMRLQARLTENSKHLGLFPEQFPHWEWMGKQLRAVKSAKVLNLFGYTGVASLVAARNGAHVAHVDASKPSINWGRDNQMRSGLKDAPIRWILDDALKFGARELRRGSRYDGILLDPPSFGRGPKKEVWKVEDQISDLLGLCRQLLSEKPLFMIITMYNIEASSLMIHNLLSESLHGLGGKIDVGELALTHAHSQKLLPLSIFGRWSAQDKGSNNVI